MKNLTGLTGVELASNSFIYGVYGNEPQIVMIGKVGIALSEECENALAEIVRKFKAACCMFDYFTFYIILSFITIPSSCLNLITLYADTFHRQIKV